MLNISNLIDEAKCYDEVRQLRWSEEVQCLHCDGLEVVRNGSHRSQPYRRQYKCKGSCRFFNDLTDTFFENQHIGLKYWILCSYFMGLNLSDQQISEELGLDKDSAHDMCEQLREGGAKKRTPPIERASRVR